MRSNDVKIRRTFSFIVFRIAVCKGKNQINMYLTKLWRRAWNDCRTFFFQFRYIKRRSNLFTINLANIPNRYPKNIQNIIDEIIANTQPPIRNVNHWIIQKIMPKGPSINTEVSGSPEMIRGIM